MREMRSSASKTMKEWPRDWKVNLIERENPLLERICFPTLPRGAHPRRSGEFADGSIAGDKPRDDV